ncbi:MAG: glycosyltransferase [Odoribacter sp.]|nr:glycosyltransferase [Odoribacter sp.]
MKKKILILISHYLPGTKIGGPLTSIMNITTNLSDYFDFYILTFDRDLGETIPYPEIVTNNWVKLDNCQVCYIRKNKTSLFQIFKHIRALNPDIIYVNSLFDPIFSISIVLAQKLNLMGDKKLIAAPRGELYNEALNFKKWKKKIFMNAAKICRLYKRVDWQATNEQERLLIIEKLKVEPERIKVARIIPTKTLPLYYNTCEQKETGNLLNIVFLARISKDKNLPFALEVLSKVKSQVQYDIYGPIEDEYIWRKCITMISLLPQNIKVEYKGMLSHEIVKETLSNYQLFFMPTFAENFGHSIAESLSVGTPVLISDNTPWKGLSEKGLGWDINLEEKEKFVEIIETWALTPIKIKNQLRIERCEKAALILHDPLIIEENIKLFTI